VPELQRTATHQCTAMHCNALQRTATHCNALQLIVMHCNALQRTATQLQHNCNTTATHCNVMCTKTFAEIKDQVTILPELIAVASMPCAVWMHVISASPCMLSPAWCSVLQHVVACCSALVSMHIVYAVSCVLQCVAACCSVLQRVAVCCSVLVVMHVDSASLCMLSPAWYSVLQRTLQHPATPCNTLQHTATHYTTLQHTATHCNTLRHTAPHCNTRAHA